MTALPVNPASLVPSLVTTTYQLLSGLESPLGFGIHGSLCHDLLSLLISPRGSCLSFEAQFENCLTGLPLHPVPFSVHCMAVATRLGALGWQGLDGSDCRRPPQGLALHWARSDSGV